MMTKIVYIICFTLIALISPKHTVACSEHQEKAPMETSCDTDQHHATNEHDCCDTETTDHADNKKDNSTCGDSNCSNFISIPQPTRRKYLLYWFS